ncbi:MAG TPA: 4-alpha-glucanotransferase [Gemmatimonadaceae bacterium]
MSNPNDGAVRELSARVGILDAYWDVSGHERRISEETRRALLMAMGVDTSTDEAARASLEVLVAEDRRDLLAPVRVVEVDDPSLATLDISAVATQGRSGAWRLEVETARGTCHVSEGDWRGDGTLTIALPRGLSLGYHRIVLSMNTGGEELSNEQTLIVVPPRCVLPEEMLGQRPAFGLIANLYSVRSRSNWGVGDFSDVAAMAKWASSVGGDFIGLNPLHALLNRNGNVSPYSPLSRLFRNPIYIDITAVPELAQSSEVQARLASPEFVAELEALRESPAVRYEQVMAVKGMALDALYRVFVERVRGSNDARAAAYREYVAQFEPSLSRFATWMTIAELEHSADWHTWRPELQSVNAETVARFAALHAPRVDFHRWVQFEADRQLGEAAICARAAGMRVGLYQDLAIGSSPTGADSWAYADHFVDGVTVGAPPDPYSADGQNWGLPPLDPRALKRGGYRYFIDLIRAAFRHAGALRIDHVMGLFRLFWIPQGMSGRDGAYVRYPAEDLLGIIALESVRHRALVVGEDLGTVPAEVPPRLSKWGVLSSKVLYFERESDGTFKRADRYPALALATANTHDMPTIAGFWSERDIELRRDLGLIAPGEEEARARAERDRDRGALVQLLDEERIIPGGAPQSSAELRAAVHGFLWSTPSQLVGLSLDDLAGETEAVNVPGVGGDRYPSWTRKMRADLEAITSSDEADVILARTRPG